MHILHSSFFTLHSSRGGALTDELFDCGREGFAELFEEAAAGPFGQPQRFGGGVNETAGGLETVSEQSLSQWHGVQRERQAIHERVPRAGFTAFDAFEVAADDALIAQRTESQQFSATDAMAGFGEGTERRFAGQLAIEFSQFADFMARRVIEGALDGGEFVGEEDALLVAQQKFFERRQVIGDGQLH